MRNLILDWIPIYFINAQDTASLYEDGTVCLQCNAIIMIQQTMVKYDVRVSFYLVLVNFFIYIVILSSFALLGRGLMCHW